MRTTAFSICCLFVATVTASLLTAGPDGSRAATRPTTWPTPTTLPASSDRGTDVVVAFYSALLQEQPPTLAQENDLFDVQSPLRRKLKDAGRGGDQEPLLLTYLRQHREWFLPVQPGRSRPLNSVMISTLGHFPRSLEEEKGAPQPGSGFVLALLHEKEGTRIVRTRTIVFPLQNWKIDPYGIRLDGFLSRMVAEELDDELDKGRK